MKTGTRQQAIGTSKKVRVFALALCGLFFARCSLAEAQQPKKVPRIGLLSAGSRSTNASRIEALRQGLRDLGYMEGQNIIIEFRYAEGDTKRFADLAAELIGLKPDVIVASSGAGALAAKSATKTIPIVFASVGD